MTYSSESGGVIGELEIRGVRDKSESLLRIECAAMTL